jgi:hypothetical protein
MREVPALPIAQRLLPATSGLYPAEQFTERKQLTASHRHTELPPSMIACGSLSRSRRPLAAFTVPQFVAVGTVSARISAVR